MKYALVILLSLVTINASAGYRERVSYWYSQNVSADVPKASKLCTIEIHDPSTGEVTLAWNKKVVANPPDKAVVDAIDDVVATDWYKDYWAEKESGGNKNTVLEAAMIATIAEITGETEQSVKTKFKKHKKAKLKEK
jgi:hypothetical protein